MNDEMTNKKIEYLMQELTNMKGSEITIEKEERHDIDRNTLELENVSIVKQARDDDDYVDPYTIQLKGKGTVINKNGSSPLPLNSYELSLKELHSIEASNEFLTIKTDRGTYILKK
ncbi:hypothetical protein ACJ2A9_02025 [Anaerobacillus sp. MEB173]|uniref:hypothetical protein n=1 Tax=Anaerobacillus sp. MEB173 TaxID=3383345 RepID=UPI003F903BCF